MPRKNTNRNTLSGFSIFVFLLVALPLALFVGMQGFQRFFPDAATFNPFRRRLNNPSSSQCVNYATISSVATDSTDTVFSYAGSSYIATYKGESWGGTMRVYDQSFGSYQDLTTGFANPGRLIVKQGTGDQRIVFLGVQTDKDSNNKSGIWKVSYTPGVVGGVTVQKFNSPTKLSLVYAVTLDPAGNLYYSRNNNTNGDSELYKCAAGSDPSDATCNQITALSSVPNQTRIKGLTVSNGILYATMVKDINNPADGKKVVAFTNLDTTPTYDASKSFSSWTDGTTQSFMDPSDISSDASGYLYVADTDAGFVYKFTPQRTFHTKVAYSAAFSVGVDTTGERLLAANNGSVSNTLNKLFCKIEQPQNANPMGYWKFNECTSTGCNAIPLSNSSLFVNPDYPLSLRPNLMNSSQGVSTNTSDRSIGSDNPGTIYSYVSEPTQDPLDYLKPRQVVTLSTWVKHRPETGSRVIAAYSATDVSGSGALKGGYGLIANVTSTTQATYTFFVNGNITGSGFQVTTPIQTIVTGLPTDVNVPWYHIVGVYDGTTGGLMSIYVDGVIKVTGTATGAPELNYTTQSGYNPPFFTVGSTVTGTTGSSGKQQFLGRVDDVAVYNRPLAATEVCALTNVYKSSSCGGGLSPTPTPTATPTPTPIVTPTPTPAPIPTCNTGYICTDCYGNPQVCPVVRCPPGMVLEGAQPPGQNTCTSCVRCVQQ